MGVELLEGDLVEAPIVGSLQEHLVDGEDLLRQGRGLLVLLEEFFLVCPDFDRPVENLTMDLRIRLFITPQQEVPHVGQEEEVQDMAVLTLRRRQVQEQFEMSVESGLIELEHLMGAELPQAGHAAGGQVLGEVSAHEFVEEVGDCPLEGEADCLRPHRNQRVLPKGVKLLVLVGLRELHRLREVQRLLPL